MLSLLCTGKREREGETDVAQKIRINVYISGLSMLLCIYLKVVKEFAKTASREMT